MNEEQLRAELAAVYASRSWRITAPLRAVSSLVSLLLHPRRLVGAILRWAVQIPLARRVGGSVLRAFPGLRRRVLNHVQHAPVHVSAIAQVTTPASQPAAIPDLSGLPVSEAARLRLAGLLRARAKASGV